jgi:hypothetical protein
MQRQMTLRRCLPIVATRWKNLWERVRGQQRRRLLMMMTTTKMIPILLQ